MNRSPLSLGLALFVALLLAASACGADDDSGQVSVAERSQDEPSVDAEAVVEPTATPAPTPTSEPEPAPGVTEDEPTADVDHEHEDTDEASEDVAPAEEAEDEPGTAPELVAAAEALVAAYNAGDWEAFTAVLGTGEPTWETGIGQASTNHIRADFEWAFALNQVMTLDGCVEDFGFLTCNLVMEDDIHRAVVAYGIEPSRCRMVFEVQEGPILAPARYDLTTCFAGYDQAFHAFGDWFEETYPAEEPIQGFHYRAWNQFGEGAPERAAAALAEWVAQIPEPG